MAAHLAQTRPVDATRPRVRETRASSAGTERTGSKGAGRSATLDARSRGDRSGPDRAARPAPGVRVGHGGPPRAWHGAPVAR